MNGTRADPSYGTRLPEHPVVAHHLAVVGRERNDRVVVHPEVVQRLTDPVDLQVDLRHQPVIPGPCAMHDAIRKVPDRRLVVPVPPELVPVVFPVTQLTFVRRQRVVLVVGPGRRVVRRMRPMERQVQEEGPRRVPPVQPVDRLRADPVRRMQLLRLVPRPRDHRVAVHPVVEVLRIRRHPRLTPQPRHIVVEEPELLPVSTPRVVQEPVVQDHVVEPEPRPLRPHVHLPDRLRVVPGAPELALHRHRMRGVERYAVRVPDPPVPLLRLPGEQRHPGRHARRRRGVPATEPHPVPRQFVQMRRLDVRMTGARHRIAPPLVDTDQDDVGSGHGASRPGLRSAGSEATGATREGRELQPHDPPRRSRGMCTVKKTPGRAVAKGNRTLRRVRLPGRSACSTMIRPSASLNPTGPTVDSDGSRCSPSGVFPTPIDGQIPRYVDAQPVCRPDRRRSPRNPSCSRAPVGRSGSVSSAIAARYAPSGCCSKTSMWSLLIGIAGRRHRVDVRVEARRSRRSGR